MTLNLDLRMPCMDIPTWGLKYEPHECERLHTMVRMCTLVIFPGIPNGP